MKTSLSIACAQSGAVLAPAVCSRMAILKTDTMTETSQRLSNARFAYILQQPRAPFRVHAKASGQREGEGVSCCREKQGISGTDGGPGIKVVSQGWDEAQCPEGEDDLKDGIRNEEAAGGLNPQEDVAEKVDEANLNMVTHGRNSECPSTLKSSGLPPSKGQVEDLAQVVQSLSQSFFTVLDQQNTLLHQRETLKGSVGNSQSVEMMNQAIRGDFGPTESQCAAVRMEGVGADKESRPLRRRVASSKRTPKRDGQRILTSRIGNNGDNVKISKEKRDMNITIGEDERFMAEALEEAKKAATAGEVPVGAVIVQKGKIIARAYNRVESEGDPTAHAEMLCLQSAAKRHGDWRLMDATLYVTLEPCPMCAGAILQSRVKGVVWGSRNILLGADGSWVSLFPDLVKEDIDGSPPKSEDEPCISPRVHPFHINLEVRRGVLPDECATIMQTFFRTRRKDKVSPFGTKPWWVPLSAWVLFKRLLHWWALLVQG